jgi:MerR family regulatory protein
MILDIADVAQRSRLPASTLRYYEEKGLISSIGRRGLRRLFEARVVELIAMRDGLRHAARCPAPSHMDCPTFKRLLKLAGMGRLRDPCPFRGRAGRGETISRIRRSRH